MHRRIVIAPDSFKGTATAEQAARSLAAGWREEAPSDELVILPMADGGEGTFDALEASVHGDTRIPLTVTGPDGRPVDATVLRMPGDEYVVELADTSGMGRLAEPLPHEAHTFGLGEAIRFAIDRGATRVLVALGGSGSTDGGAGALIALGARLLDARGEPIGLGNRGLLSLASADLSGIPPLPSGGLVALADVTNPLLGPAGAAAVFGPQKGASEADVAVLEAGLNRLAAVLGHSSGNPSADAASGRAGLSPDTPGAGAAGGTGYGLLAIGATLEPGAALVADAIGLLEALLGADAVITGEGAFDAQTASGKAPDLVAELAAAAGVPVHLVAGRVDAGAPTDAFASATSLTDLAGSGEAAMAEPERWLAAAGRRLARG